MSLFDCLADAMDEGSADKERGKRAQEMWKERADQYERQGHPRHVAEVFAGEDVKAAFKKEAGDVRNRALGVMASVRRTNLEASSATNLKKLATKKLDQMELERRSLIRRVHGQIGQFLTDHTPTITGKVQKPAQFANILRELHGKSTGDETARIFAEAINNAREDMRLRLNSLGHNIGKLENRGLRHNHNRLKVTRAGFNKWFSDIDGKIDWTRIEDSLTGKPLQGEGGPMPSLETRQRFLSEVYANIHYGKGSREAVYGRHGGSRALEKERVLHFKTAEDWIDYNKVYGSSSPFNSIIIELEHLAREVAISNHLGPEKAQGMDYLSQAVVTEGRKRGLSAVDARKVEANAIHAQRMLNVLSGGVGPKGIIEQRMASFFSTTRKLFSAAALDRAIIISVPSDLNSARLAAQAVGMNPDNVITTYTNLMAEAVRGGHMTKDDLLRQQWVLDSMANPGVTMDRFDSEWGVQEWAGTLSNAAMRIQGLNAHTDGLRIAFQKGFSAHFASNAHLPLSKIEPVFQDMMREHGITDANWDAFRSQGMFTAPNGATFLNPLYWREAVDMDPKAADDLFLKFQSFVEDFTEKAVPTGSLFVKGAVDPAAHNLSPGTIPYELLKSAGMFKSFVGAFTINQVRMVAMKRGNWNKAAYITDMLATSSLVGAIGLQVNDLLMGRDPQDMTKADFWMRSIIKGGGFGPVGDIIQSGQASFGGGIGSYLAGPIPQIAQDVYALTIKNAVQLASGEDTNFAAEFAKFGKQYTPMGQTPLAAGGAAIDRLFWDQLQLILDPDSADALVEASQKRDNRNGGGTFWIPGQAIPSRGPNLANAVGQ